MPPSHSSTRANYNRLSRWYDLISGSTEHKYRQIGLQKLAAQPGERILEIGFGTGHCLLALAQAVGDSGKIYGIDLSEGMAAVARKRIQEAGVSERVVLQIGDATHMPFAGLELDAVFMSFTLELFETPEIPLVLQQCHAALRPGGRIAIVTLALPPKPGLAVRIYEWFHRHMPTVVDCRPIQAQPALQTAGFDVQDVATLLMWGLPVEIILARR